MFYKSQTTVKIKNDKMNCTENLKYKNTDYYRFEGSGHFSLFSFSEDIISSLAKELMYPNIDVEIFEKMYLVDFPIFSLFN